MKRCPSCVVTLSDLADMMRIGALGHMAEISLVALGAAVFRWTHHRAPRFHRRLLRGGQLERSAEWPAPERT